MSITSSRARKRWQAEQAETKIKQEVFEGRFGLVQSGMIKLDKFIDEIYMPWAKANKRSWKGNEIYTAVLKDYFKGKSLCEISPFLIEKFKHERIKTPTKNGTPRAHASVNREFETLSRLFNLALDFKKAESNPCRRVKKFKLTLTIMTLMGHKDLKTTMRYVRAVQLQRKVSSQNLGHKSFTQDIRPPVLAAVSY